MQLSPKSVTALYASWLACACMEHCSSPPLGLRNSPVELVSATLSWSGSLCKLHRLQPGQLAARLTLPCTLLILTSSFSFDDNIGQTFGIYIIAIAGAESVIGLSILVAYYRLRGNISLRT